MDGGYGRPLRQQRLGSVLRVACPAMPDNTAAADVVMFEEIMGPVTPRPAQDGPLHRACDGYQPTTQRRE